MKIIVPIKQVPETGNVRMDHTTGTIIREGVESIINPLDLYAIEIALRIKEAHQGSVVIPISMGPPSAARCLREAISMGCDDGVLLSAKEFAGSDTWSTAKIISEACNKIGNFDLIITGERATDGDTAQVGPGVATFLDIPIATYVSQIKEIGKNNIIVSRLVEGGYEILSLPRPCLLTVLKEIAIPRLPKLSGKQLAQKVSLTEWSINDLPSLNAEEVGLAGSPTRVVKIDTPKVTRQGKKFLVTNEKELEESVEALLMFLREKNLISKKELEI